LANDFAENHNVAAQNRPRLIEMIATWYVEAGKYDVLPVDSRGTARFADERPKIAVDRTSYVFYPRTQGVPVNATANILNRPYSITADVEIPQGGAEGVLLSQGGNDGGYALYVQNGKLSYAYNYVGRNLYYVESTDAVAPGRHQLRFEFAVTDKPDIAHGKGAPGKGQLYIDGKLVGQGDIPLTNPLAIGLLSTINCGADVGAPVTPKYKPPFPFTGKIYKVTVDVSGDLIHDHEAELRRHLARQ
jgi:arylsulfatase